MEISVEVTNELERRMTIALPSHLVDSAVNERLQEAARNVRMNGFRKGKVPLNVVKNRFGKGVRQEVLGELMNKSYYEALSQKRIRPAGQPRIEATEVGEGKDLTFTAVFEVYPEIVLPDFGQIKVQRLVADVGQDNIDKMIETLREQRQTWQPVDRPAADGDMVNVDYVGTLNGEEFSGGQAKGSSIVLGSKRMIPGFEEGLLGKQAGDTATLELTFPAKYHNAELAGKDVVFTVAVNKVSEQAKPDLDETFFASFGITDGGLEAFRKEVAENMAREMKTASRNKLKNRVIDALLKICEVKAPAALVDSEVVNLRNQALQQMGVGPKQKIDPSLLPDELFREQAERRVVSGLILGEVISQQKLVADPAKVRAAVEELASTYESPDEVINWYYGNRENLANIESTVLEDEVFDYVLGNAVVEEKKVSYEEVIKSESSSDTAGKPAEA